FSRARWRHRRSASGPGTRGTRWRYRGWSPCNGGTCAWPPACPVGRSCSGVVARAGAGGGATLFLLVPAELDLAAHARTGGDGERGGLDVAGEHAGFEQVDALGGFDVAFQFAGDGDLLRAHATGELGALFDGQVAFDVDVALELARDADMAGAVDLAFDG